MPQQTYIASDIQGLTPALDGRVSKKLFILSGSNFRFDSRGPRSAFGSQLLAPRPVTMPEGSQTFDVRAGLDSYSFVITADSILLWDPIGHDFEILLRIPDTSGKQWRWTHAYLNGIIYLCHPVTGIIYWNLGAGVIGYFYTPGAPLAPIAVAVNNGRLGIMDANSLSWSGPFNGFDFQPQLAGAGIQRISQHVSGAPIALSSYSKGFLVWTTDGVMRSEYTGDEIVYRHRTLNTKYRPVNSFSMAQMDDETTVFLDPRGLYQCTGDQPEVFTPLFSTFLIEYLKLNGLRSGNNTRVEWDSTHQQLFVSISHDFEGPFFAYAFVCQINIDKWGLFSRRHRGLGTLGDLEFGFIDEFGFIRTFVDDAQNDDSTGPGGDLVRARGGGIAQQIDSRSSWKLGTSLRANTRGFGLTPVAGWYAPAATGPSSYPQLQLDSAITLGYVRGFDLDSNDRLTEITQLAIGSVETMRDGTVVIDANQITGSFDSNQLVGGTDLGLRPIGVSNFNLSVTSTLDGVTEFVTENPVIARLTPAERYYALTVPGLWHTIKLFTLLPGERFHLRSMELTYVDGGKFL